MLDRKSRLPYYLQIKDYISAGIADGTFPVGSKIPSESEFTQMFSVSRITVRQAIESLTQAGFLEKLQGKGTFVRLPKVTQELNVITSWTETMAERGIHTDTREISCSEIEAADALAEALKIEPGTPVYMIERLRFGENEPICIMKNYIPVDVAPNLIFNEQIRFGIYAVLEGEYNIELASAVETIEARAASSREAEQLHIRRGAPLLFVQRITYGPDDKPVELVTVASRANKYAYSIKLSGRPEKSKGSAE